MAVTREVEFQGQRVGLMAEYFATMADVYRIAGELDEHHDQMSAADNGDKTIAASYRRLARMIGCDDHDFTNEDWQQLALQLKTKQLQQLQQACLLQLDRKLLPEHSILVGAGVGKFLARQLAATLGLAYQDLSEIIANSSTDTEMDIADCAPAVAVACLAKTLF
jgi:probable H4MPT-linked C1 transfer pathway protein